MGGYQDGLNMYDGYSFKVYRHKLEDSNSISGNYIQCINEDVEGNLWVGTIGNGLNKWSRDLEKFTCYSSKLDSECELPEDNVYGLSFDVDSALWVKTDNYLLKLDHDPVSKSTYGLYSSIFKYQEKLNVPIFYKSPHLLWIGTKDGIAQFNSQERLYERFIVDPEEGIYSNQLGAITGILKLDSNSLHSPGYKVCITLFKKKMVVISIER